MPVVTKAYGAHDPKLFTELTIPSETQSISVPTNVSSTKFLTLR